MSGESSLNEKIKILKKRDEDNSTNKISALAAVAHIVKGNIGTGILAMPYAIMNAGLFLGIAGLIFMAIICVYCMNLLLKSSRYLCEELNVPYLSFADVAEMSFAISNFSCIRKFSRIAKSLINVFLCITQIGFCCVYIVFVSQHLKSVLDLYIEDYNYRIYILALILPTILLCFIRNLKLLAPLMVLANILELLSICLIFYYIFDDLPNISEKNFIASWSTFPLFFGTVVFTFEGIGLVLPIENEMKRKEQFSGWNGVLNVSMTFITIIYLIMGIFGYWKYGEDLKGSVILSLPSEDTMVQVIKLSISLAIFLSYAIQFYVIVDIIFPSLSKCLPSKNLGIFEYIFRALLVLFTCGMGAAIPDLGLFISLVGAVSSSFLALLAPPIIDTITHWNHIGKLKLSLNIFIFLFGVIGFIFGTYISLSDVIKYFT